MNQCITIESLQFIIDRLQVWFNFFFIDFHIVNFLHQLHQLLFANLHSVRNSKLTEFCSGRFFNLTNTIQVFRMHNGNRHSCFTGTGCTSATVHVILQFIRKIVMDYVCYILHINSTGCYICRYQQLQSTVTVSAHYFIALRLT